MKPLMVFQPSKFGMLTFVALHTVCFIVFFSLTGKGKKIFWFLVREQKGGNFESKGGWTTFEWNFGRAVKSVNKESASFNR